ncbi:cyclic nucleotide-binding domain-containing protein [Thermodesulfobacteriota bacterium]
MSEHELLMTLRESKLLKGFLEDDLAMISSRGRRLAFQKNATLIKEGQVDHPLYVVIKGHVEVVLPKERDGQGLERATRVKLCQLVQGDFIGEYALIDREPASASVIAAEPCEVFEITQSDFDRILNSSDRLAKNIYRNMLQVTIKRARDSNKELDICF